MPRYDFDPSKVQAALEVFPKGEYEFKFGEPKAFQKEAGEDKHLSIGIRYQVTIMSGPLEGKRSVYTAYLHGDAGGFAKQMVMAALGFKRTAEDEKRFNETYKAADWSYDTDTGACGDLWRKVTGQRAFGSVDVQPNKNNPAEQLQQWTGWRPLNQASPVTV